MERQLRETKITDAGIKKFFKEHDFPSVLSEYIWNGFDANSKLIDIEIIRNTTDQIEQINISDNGSGIDIENLDKNFDKFNESEKNSSIDYKGKNGRGRLSFFKICQLARWTTKRDNEFYELSVFGNDLTKFSFIKLDNSNSKFSTRVELLNFSKHISDTDLRKYLENEFSWYLSIYPDKKVILNGTPLPTPNSVKTKRQYIFEEISFEVFYIQWIEKPNSEKSINYFIDTENTLVEKFTNKFNRKGQDFFLSTIIKSEAYDLQELELNDPQKNSRYEKAKREIKKQIYITQQDLFLNFLTSKATAFIEKIEENRTVKFSTGELANIKNSQYKKIIKEIYISDPQIFSSKNQKQTSVILNLIYKLVSSDQSDELLNIFHEVLNLTEDDTTNFSKIIDNSSLQSIIKTIEVLDKRKQTISYIKEIIFNRRFEILETPHLQKIIEANTWLFGPQYSILGAEEDSFKKIAENLRDQIKGITVINPDEDIEEELRTPENIEGAQKQVDLFLTQDITRLDHRNQEYKQFVIIEIKRPSVSLNKKHLDQISEYSEIIQKYPSIYSNQRKFDIILVGRKISDSDFAIKDRLDSLKEKLDPGLVLDNKRGIKIYIKTWCEIFDEFDLQNSYLLKNYKNKIKDLESKNTKDLVEMASIKVD